MPTFLRGAKPSPRHKLLAAVPHVVLHAPPPQFAVAPTNLNMEGNDKYGNCVSAEESVAKAIWSLICGLVELLPTAAECIAFARQYGFLDGATLTEVMDVMKSKGMAIGGKVYKDGGYNGVDYSSETVLQSAIASGPVKVAIDADALPSGAGNKQGWTATGGSPGQFSNTDHCISYFGYGTAAYLFGLLGLPVPAGLSATKMYYLAYTWATIGVVDHDWIMSTTTEAWVRTPTTPGQSPGPNGTAVVPGIVGNGATWDSARRSLVNAGLLIAPAAVADPTAKTIGQSPPQGTVVPVGSTVTVTLAAPTSGVKIVVDLPNMARGTVGTATVQ